MATIPVYTTFVAGTVVTAAQLNTQIVAAGNFWLAAPFCQVYCSASPSIPNNTFTLVSFDGELEDNDSMHNTVTNNSRVICTTPGSYDLSLWAGWTTNATGGRYIAIRLNSGGSFAGGTFVTSASSAPTASGTDIITAMNIPYRFVNPGDYLEMFVMQLSGGALALAGGAYFTGMSARFKLQ